MNQSYPKPSNNAPVILIETHETPLFGPFKGEQNKLWINKNLLTYSRDFALPNKYLEIIIKCVKPKILDDKVEILFYKIENSE